VTGWAYDEIIYQLPFAVGLQILHAEDCSKGKMRPWKFNNRTGKIDVRSKIEEMFQ
jgi:hypothetical protein